MKCQVVGIPKVLMMNGVTREAKKGDARARFCCRARSEMCMCVCVVAKGRERGKEKKEGQNSVCQPAGRAWHKKRWKRARHASRGFSSTPPRRSKRRQVFIVVVDGRQEEDGVKSCVCVRKEMESRRVGCVKGAVESGGG